MSAKPPGSAFALEGKLLHTQATLAETIDTKRRQAFVHLSALDLRQGLDRRQPAILRQGKRYRVQSRRKRAHGVLLYRWDLLSSQHRASPPGNQKRTSSAALATAIEELISAAPPPYTTRLSLIRFRTAQIESCNARFASSTI